MAAQLSCRDLRKLAKRMDPAWTLKANGASKFAVVDRVSGKPLRYPDGRPVTFPSTPSTWRTITDLRLRLEKLGVLR